MSRHLSAGSALLVSELTRLRLPTGDENRYERKPKLSGPIMPTNRAHGVAGQNSRAHSRRAGKQEKFQPRGVFFLDFPFYRTILEVFYYPRCRAALYRHLTAK